VRTIILTGDARGEKPVGTWLRDLGFKLVEVGAEVNIMKLTGMDAQQLLESKGMEVVHVVDAYETAMPKAPTHGSYHQNPEPRRAGARAFPEEAHS
jgi:hypothetical protein